MMHHTNYKNKGYTAKDYELWLERLNCDDVDEFVTFMAGPSKPGVKRKAALNKTPHKLPNPNINIEDEKEFLGEIPDLEDIHRQAEKERRLKIAKAEAAKRAEYKRLQEEREKNNPEKVYAEEQWGSF